MGFGKSMAIIRHKPRSREGLCQTDRFKNIFLNILTNMIKFREKYMMFPTHWVTTYK